MLHDCVRQPLVLPEKQWSLGVRFGSQYDSVSAAQATASYALCNEGEEVKAQQGIEHFHSLGFTVIVTNSDTSVGQ